MSSASFASNRAARPDTAAGEVALACATRCVPVTRPCRSCPDESVYRAPARTPADTMPSSMDQQTSSPSSTPRRKAFGSTLAAEMMSAASSPAVTAPAVVCTTADHGPRPSVVVAGAPGAGPARVTRRTR